LPSVVPSTARSQDFAGGILPFEATAAARYADIVPARRQAGNPIEGFDAPIAATALAREASVATRDTGGFSACGHTLIGTWTV
jgi:toxin FitB